MDIINQLKDNRIFNYFYEVARNECLSNNCQSTETMLVIAIEKMAEELENVVDGDPRLVCGQCGESVAYSTSYFKIAYNHDTIDTDIIDGITGKTFSTDSVKYACCSRCLIKTINDLLHSGIDINNVKITEVTVR